jgi:superfamily I DNA/RNA helicase
MRRVVRLLWDGVQPDRILLISFTRVAAADLRDKVADLDVPGAEEVRATTLHAFCFGLLQHESVLAATGRKPRILLDHEVDLMLRDIGGDYGNIYDRRAKLEAFVAGWARNPNDYPGIPGNDEERSFQAAVQAWLRRHMAMLIGEVVPEAYRYLAANPHADALMAFDHIIVDEYQDLNALEQQLLDRLSELGSLCVAGDDDQSIYSVRHANPAGIHAFLERPEVEEYSIGTCGRCGTQILAIANSLIGCAPDRSKAPLVALDGAETGAVAIIQWSHTDAEVDGIVAAIAQDIAGERLEAGQVLVLTNWAELGRRIRDRLVGLGISAKSYFREQALRSDDSRAALALLRLVCAHKDFPALRVLLGLGDADGRSDAYRRIESVSDSEGSDVWTTLERLASGESLGVNARALTERFSAAVARVEQLVELAPTELVDTLLPEDSETLAELRAVALDSLDDAETACDVLRAIVDAVTQDDVPQNPDFVRVMSLHKSKGLTCASVYVVGAVAGVVPTIRANGAAAHEAAMREGRRLFFVAITRAAHELTISSSISTDLAQAAARGVRFDKKTIRLVGGRHVVRTIASPYMIELGPTAPKPQVGETWLESRTD